MKISTRWFRGLKTEAERKKRTEFVLSNPSFLDLLAEIVKAEIAELDATSVESYDNPNWALKEADRKGQIRFAKRVLELTQRTS